MASRDEEVDDGRFGEGGATDNFGNFQNHDFVQSDGDNHGVQSVLDVDPINNGPNLKGISNYDHAKSLLRRVCFG